MDLITNRESSVSLVKSKLSYLFTCTLLFFQTYKTGFRMDVRCFGFILLNQTSHVMSDTKRIFFLFFTSVIKLSFLQQKKTRLFGSENNNEYVNCKKYVVTNLKSLINSTSCFNTRKHNFPFSLSLTVSLCYPGVS